MTPRSRTRARGGTGRGDRGALSLELAILGPALLMVLALVIAAGRIYLSGSSVDDAARDAARAASLQSSPVAAQGTAEQVADQTLASEGLHCTSTTVTVPTAGFTVPLGQPASVTVTVSCRAALSDIGLPGLPGSKLLTSSFTSSLDPYRPRSTS
jgi:Flp pilus assembly protein TadG